MRPSWRSERQGTSAICIASCVKSLILKVACRALSISLQGGWLCGIRGSWLWQWKRVESLSGKYKRE